MSQIPGDYSVAGRHLFLASASPRRRELLQQIGVRFQVMPSQVDETRFPDESAAAYVVRLARAKTRAALDRMPADLQAVVLGADTVVVCGGQSLGKPRHRQDALRMLGLLSDCTHQVLTAVALGNHAGIETALSCTDVTFRAISDDEMDRYWHSGEPRDKAGAYGIQGLGGVFVRQIQGSYSGVVGLPLFETAELLGRFGIPCWQPDKTHLSDQQ